MGITDDHRHNERKAGDESTAVRKMGASMEWVAVEGVLKQIHANVS